MEGATGPFIDESDASVDAFAHITVNVSPRMQLHCHHSPFWLKSYNAKDLNVSPITLRYPIDFALHCLAITDDIRP